MKIRRNHLLRNGLTTLIGRCSVASLWLALSVIVGTLIIPIKVYDHNKNTNLSSYKAKDCVRVLAKLANTYKFLPPGKNMLEVTVIKSNDWNSYCLGQDNTKPNYIEIVVNSGMLKELKNEDELAYILGHELGHCLLGHSRYPQVYSESTVNSEALADLTGYQMMRIAGYDPGYCCEPWKRKIAELGDQDGVDHPRYSDRVRILKTDKFWYHAIYEDISSFGYHLEYCYDHGTWSPKVPSPIAIRIIHL